MVSALALFAVAERRDPWPVPTMLSRLMIPLSAVFLFFSVALDVYGRNLPIAVEDGGEVLALTAFLVMAAIWTRRADDLARLSTTDQGLSSR